MANIEKNPNTFSKTDPRYWEKRVFRPKRKVAGEDRQSKIYAVRIQARGRRDTFSTGESSKKEAGKIALEIYLAVRGGGWEAALEQFKGVSEKISDLTVGQFIEEVRKVTSVKPRTFETYVYKLRHIVAGVANIKLPEGMKKQDHYSGHSKEWKERVNSVKLAKITPEKINRWKLDHVARASSDPRDQLAKKRTVNTYIRNAKALFSRQNMAFLKHLELPEPLPFSNVFFEKEGSMRYRSQCDPKVLLKEAVEELHFAKPESEIAIYKGKAMSSDLKRAREIQRGQARSKHQAFIILLLSLTTGLRRNEIDKLQWEQILWSKKVLRIETTDCFEPKCDSDGDIPLDDEVLEFLRQIYLDASTRFVIDGGEPKPEVTYRHYRAHRHFDTLIQWLRDKGIKSRNPVHAMRKEYGTLICEQAGILAASHLLRHSDIRITEKYYIAEKRSVVSGLGSALSGIAEASLSR